jgi:hypothetical protein
MTFISTKIEVGDKVKSNNTLKICNGFFTKGHEFIVIGIGERGFDLQDEDGNRIGEVHSTTLSLIEKAV